MHKITLLPGDGIGPEIIAQAQKVLERIACKYGHSFIFNEYPVGGAAYDLFGQPLTEEVMQVCQNSRAVLMGAVGGPKWSDVPVEMRPEQALLGLRSVMGVYNNLRPICLYRQLAGASPLKAQILSKGIDIMIVRELTGGIYFGPRQEGTDSAFDTEIYNRAEITRIVKQAFVIAQNRNKYLTLVDKANVLASSRLWRRVAKELAKEYPDVKLDYLYVDNAAMQLILDPAQFDVIVTANMFGDILSDEAAVLTGSIGMLASASLGDNNCGLYEPVHGSAPELAGKDVANPLAAILSAALMLRYSLGLKAEAEAVEQAVEQVLSSGLRTRDIYQASDNLTLVRTSAMGQAVCERI
ncbi:MAG: 3-isopropylmalate dehydrogenase [Bacillota bacterium]|jgi:3-isopropylmalate dehydrogenase